MVRRRASSSPDSATRATPPWPAGRARERGCDNHHPHQWIGSGRILSGEPPLAVIHRNPASDSLPAGFPPPASVYKHILRCKQGTAWLRRGREDRGDRAWSSEATLVLHAPASHACKLAMRAFPLRPALAFACLLTLGHATSFGTCPATSPVPVGPTPGPTPFPRVNPAGLCPNLCPGWGAGATAVQSANYL